ncbi:uncharacterized protein [Nicotiana sylvestris]|uniref:uncharacterized protein n=1 Tax=Nicotiana sylvestris TaxID=4096 RepID=UPI00388C6087
MKAQALADHLVENSVDEEYEPLKTYFPDEEVMNIDKVEKEEKPGWKLFFDGAANVKGVGIGAVLISKIGHYYPVTTQLRFYCTNNMSEYEACILGLRLVIDTGIQEVLVHDQHAYCNMVEEELDGEPWFHDIKEYIRSGVYPVQPTGDQKRTIQRLASRFFFSGGVLYNRTPDLRLLRPIEPASSNGHRFILVAIDYFTNWIEAKTFKSVTKKAVVDFVHANIICQFEIPKVIITDNGANLNVI